AAITVVGTDRATSNDLPSVPGSVPMFSTLVNSTLRLCLSNMPSAIATCTGSAAAFELWAMRNVRGSPSSPEPADPGPPTHALARPTAATAAASFRMLTMDPQVLYMTQKVLWSGC